LQTSNLILDFEFDQHLESHKHVINIIMGFRDMGCYNLLLQRGTDLRGAWCSHSLRKSTPSLIGGPRARPSVNKSQKIGETGMRRHSVPRNPSRSCTASRRFRNRSHDCLGLAYPAAQERTVAWETPSETLRYQRRAPRCLRDL
jgi:hypothetical protein